LAEAVQNRDEEIFFENAVKNVTFLNHHARICIEDSNGRQKYLNAGFLLDTSGYGQFLSKLLGLAIDSSLPPRQALFCHVEGDVRPAGREEGKIWIVAIHEDAWVWIIPFSNGITSVGAVGNPNFFESLPGDLAEKLLRSLQLNARVADRLKNLRFIFPPRTIRDYSASVKQLHGSGYALSGNAAGFLDPIFSNGITVALESSNRAAKTILRHLSGETVDWSRDYDEYVLSGMEVFKAYVNAWYDGWLHSIFHHPRKNETVMKQIVSILSGYVWDSKNPLVRQPLKRLSMILSQIGFEEYRART
jgi:flavin-dependent dehydrogenase